MLQMRRGRTAVAGVMALGLCAAVVGCGSDSGGGAAASSSNSGGGSSSTGSDVVSAAKQDVAAMSKEPTGWPGTASGPAVPAGAKKLAVITCTQQAVGCADAAKGIQEAVKVLGWSATVVDGKADPSVWNSAILKAVASKADAIVLTAVPPQAVGESIAKAKAAHIPVVVNNQPPATLDGVYAMVDTDIHKQGTAVANWVIADSGGSADLINLTDPEDPQLKQFADAFTTRIQACSGCKIEKTVQYSLATMATQLPQAVSSAVASSPKAGYINANLDSPATFVTQGLQQAGKAGKLQILGYNGDPDAIERIRNGEQAVTITTPETWVGFESVNQVVRALAGAKPSTFPLPTKLITKDNAPEGRVWDPSGIDYRARYRKLWGK